MRTLLIGLVALLAAAALLADSAFAQEAGTYPGQVPVTDPISLQAIVVATQFWRDRGLTDCPDGVQTFMADSLFDGDGIYAMGRGGDCQAWLSNQPLHDLRTYLDFPTYRDKRFAAADECREWTHEIGHALGLAHSADGGVMDPVHMDTPYACLVWAKHLYPAPARRVLARHSEPPRRPADLNLGCVCDLIVQAGLDIVAPRLHQHP